MEKKLRSFVAGVLLSQRQASIAIVCRLYSPIQNREASTQQECSVYALFSPILFSRSAFHLALLKREGFNF